MGTTISTMPIKLTYFNIAGKAEKVRLAFVINGAEFEDCRIDGSQWAELKPTTKFGQLPLLQTDGKTFAQSDAMLRFAGRQGDALRVPEAQLELVDEVMGLIDDFSSTWAPCLYISMKPGKFGYPEGYGTTEEGAEKIKIMREQFVAEQLPQFCAWFQGFISASGGPFLCGSAPSIADCMLVPELIKFTKGFIDHVPATCLDANADIQAYLAAFMAIPQVEEYYAAGAK